MSLNERKTFLNGKNAEVRNGIKIRVHGSFVRDAVRETFLRVSDVYVFEICLPSVLVLSVDLIIFNSHSVTLLPFDGKRRGKEKSRAI